MTKHNGDLISRSALLAEFGEEPLSWNDEDWEVQERMDWRKYTADVRNAPAVDAVEVERCKDCDYSFYNECSGLRRCTAPSGMHRIVEDMEFCAWGERRDEE